MEKLPSLRQALPVWTRIALLSFGGPAAQIAVMHRILVDEKRWISDARFVHALNYCMLLPGPEAQQLATYIGWLMHRTRGGLIAGGLFILPGIFALMALSVIYVLYGTIPAVSAAFFGLKCAVLVIIASAILRLAKRILKSRAKVVIAFAAFTALFAFSVPFPLIILTAGFLGFFGARNNWSIFLESAGHASAKGDEADLISRVTLSKPNIITALKTAAIWGILWLMPTITLLIFLGSANIFTNIAVFFSKMAVVTFGGAYAVLAYVAQQAVETHHWLSAPEILDGLGMAETTPGPLIMVLQFVGFIAAYRGETSLSPLWSGVLGGLLATWVTFTPCFLWVFTGAPYVEALRQNKALNGALSSISAAIVGVLCNLGLWMAIHTLFKQTLPVRSFGLHFDMPNLANPNLASLALTVLAGFALFRLKYSVPLVLVLSIGSGLIAGKLGLT